MYYRPAEGHGLVRNPFNAIVSPRPIGWISSRSKEGVDNLAPYSFFNAVAYEPPQVMFAASSSPRDGEETKDSVNNIRETGVFAVNVVGAAMKAEMNATSAAAHSRMDEYALADIEKAQCNEIECARVAAAPATLECRLTQIVDLKGHNNVAVFGEVVGVHIADEHLREGRFDVRSVQPLSRLGYLDYAIIKEVFEMERPS